MALQGPLPSTARSGFRRVPRGDEYQPDQYEKWDHGMRRKDFVGSVRTCRRAAFHRTAQKREENCAEQHETEDMKTIVESLKIRFAPHDAVESNECLAPRCVSVTSRQREFLRERGESVLGERVIRANCFTDAVGMQVLPDGEQCRQQRDAD